ncbi:MAG TPA: hypothetical protein VFZ37_12405 [Jiangellaceae bacterium]
MRTILTLALSAVALTACAVEAEDSDEPSVTVRLVIPDGNIREPGATCSGASAFRFAHPDAEYTLLDPSGTAVSVGTLPQGVAEKAFTIDLGDDQRQPTTCVMSLEVVGVGSVDGHSLVIADHFPVPIRPNPNLDDIPEAVLS